MDLIEKSRSYKDTNSR